MDVKTAYVHGLDSFAIKIAADFFGNRCLGLPTGSGMTVLISAQTGRPMGVGVQDTMIARLAYERAKARGLGTAFRA